MKTQQHPTTRVSEEVRTMVHGFSDRERREAVRLLADKVAALEKRVEALTEALKERL